MASRWAASWPRTWPQARPVLAAVLETTATNATGLVESQLPWYARPFVSIEMAAPLRQADNLAAAARFAAPTLVIAAGKDRTTPPRMGKAVFDAVPRSDKRWLLLEDAGHNGALHAPGAGAAYCDFVRAAAG
ncbi:alpha/beta fold hydrolase [Massilia sp. Dwa41.01b]|uniref:alpha/beta fold hydrolase n=1 Tax=Massilia sp. Dwa41.01b TaxID=2709302 RepID=UPI001E44009C|nr:alpha/beta hydrolase [Massilia sp. Dwa41.01b]